MLWCAQRRLHVTVVVKARYRFVQDGVMTPMLPEPVRAQEGELAPYLAQADVVLTAGHACACPPQPVSALAVRLAVYRGWAVIDKSLLVYGRSAPGAQTQPSVERVSLVARGDDAEGLIVNPSDLRQPGSFTRLEEHDATRASLVAGRALPVTRRQITELPDQFPWGYFQVSPAAQRSTYLTGDEWLVLDGMHATYPRLQSRLPGAAAQVRAYSPGLGASQGPCYEVAMQADRLNIDADRLTVTVLWRGSFPVADENTARALTLVGGVALPGKPIAWPDAAQLLESPKARTPSAAVEETTDSMALTTERQRPPGLQVPAHSVREANENDAYQRDATVKAPPDFEPGAALARLDEDAAAELSDPADPLLQSGELELSEDGVLGLSLSDVDGIRAPESASEGDELDGLRTVELASPVGSRMAAGVLPEPEQKRLLRPQLEGDALPAGAPGRPKGEGTRAPASAAEGEQVNLPARPLDALQQTLSESLDEMKLSNLETLAELSWRVPKE